MKMDYYDLLELNDNCTKEEIKKQYHKLSKKYHPDKNNGNDTQFKEIKEAFDILYDEMIYCINVLGSFNSWVL